MRPAFGAPVGSPAVVIPAQPGKVISAEPDPSEPFLSPAPAASATAPTDSVNRASISPPVPRAAEEEPSLNMNLDPTPGPTPTNPSGPELTRPTAARSSGLRGTSGRVVIPRSSPTTSAIDRLKPFLADSSGLLQPAKAERPWKYIVVHHSATPAGGLDQIDHDHRKILGYEGCGYHFVIGNGTDTPDGRIEASERWVNQKQGVHCRNGKTADINEYGVGICLVGNFDQTQPTPKQVAAASALVAYLEKRYRISPDHAGTHDQFASTPTACPGRNFPGELIFGRTPLASR